MTYIELHRTFKAELETAPEMTWQDLLQKPCAVILAEGGSGKTAEFQHQAKRLATEGEPAFFIPMERLLNQSLREYLQEEEGAEASFNQWLPKREAPGYFFLDSVDEAKLRDTACVDKVLRKLKAGLSHRHENVHLYLSCRPADWNAVKDIQTFKQHFSDAEAYLLQPLNREQARIFLKEKLGSPEEARACLQALQEKGGGGFLTRPLDLDLIADSWRHTKAFGTLKEIIEVFITRSADEHNTERGKPDTLSSQDAREGFRRLALAMTRTNRFSLLTRHEAQGQPDALRPQDILPDWSEKLDPLLNRRLFEPESVGRLRFSHRTFQEYLAAEALHRLHIGSQGCGLSFRDLRDLLFVSKEGITVVRHTMRPIAAWLSLWNEAILREVIQHDPELLFQAGDRRAFPIPKQAEISDGISQFDPKHNFSIGRRGVKPTAFHDPELWRQFIPSSQNADTEESIISLISEAAKNSNESLKNLNEKIINIDNAESREQLKEIAPSTDEISIDDLYKKVIYILNLNPNTFPEPLLIQEAKDHYIQELITRLPFDGLMKIYNDPRFSSYQTLIPRQARFALAHEEKAPPIPPAEYHAWEQNLAAPITTKEQALALILNRLEDIQYDLSHHPFNLRPLFTKNSDEHHFQRYLAGELDRRKNGLYGVEREPEAADNKKPDILLHFSPSNLKAVIELKRQDYSINNLKQTLETQITGQYLRHQECTIGVLVICHHDKGYHHPEKNKPIPLSKAAEILQAHAKKITQGTDLRLGVFALSFASPLDKSPKS